MYICGKNNCMKTEQVSIGKLIADEVRKQGMSITDFAEKICCKRNNVYNIFDRTSIDILQLKRISKVLKRNFFKEIAEDLDLVLESGYDDCDIVNQKSVSQFFLVVPDILHSMGKTDSIVFCKLEGSEGYGLPDFGLSNNFITFTIGNKLKERIVNSELLDIREVEDERGVVEVCENKLYGSVCVNIKVDYKTEREWQNIMQLAFEAYDRNGGR